MKSLSFSTGTGTYISLQIPAHLFPRAFFIMKALVYQNAASIIPKWTSRAGRLLEEQALQLFSSYK